MAYNNPQIISYNFGSVNFATGSTAKLKPPPGKSRGSIIDVHVSVTVLFTQVTTPGYSRIGKTGTAAYYAEVNMGAAAAGAAYNFRDNKTVSRQIDLVADAVSDVLVTFVAPTGGSPAGTGIVTVAIGWF